MNGFDAARLKIDRADKHIADIESIVRSLPDRYVSSIEIDAKGSGHSIKYALPDFYNIDAGMALILGDAIHNLKTALDYWWVTATNGATIHSEFPVRRDVMDLENTLRGAKIDITFPLLFQWITATVKPYPAGDFHLSVLHKVNIADKHRLLLSVVRNAYVTDIMVEDQDGKVTGSSCGIPGVNEFRLYFKRHVKIHDKGKLSLYVFFDDRLIPESLEIMESLRFFRGLTIRIVNEIEKIR